MAHARAYLPDDNRPPKKSKITKPTLTSERFLRLAFPNPWMLPDTGPTEKMLTVSLQMAYQTVIDSMKKMELPLHRVIAMRKIDALEWLLFQSRLAPEWLGQMATNARPTLKRPCLIRWSALLLNNNN